MVFSSQTANPGGQDPGDRSPRRSGKSALILGVVAVVLILVFGYFSLTLFRRLERQLAGIGQQTDEARREAQRAQEQAAASAEEALRSSVSAQVAAQQRDQARQAQAESEAQAEAALQQAGEAERRAEEYRLQREAELARLQQVLGQIAETRRTAMGLVMTLGEDSIRFDFDRSDIKPEYRDILNRIAGVLMTLQGFSIYVYGYTDDVGPQEYNLGLSERRAQAVRDVLVDAGVNSPVETQGFGESDPRVPGNSSQARAANRRVEIGLVYTTLSESQPVPQP
jgi:outer membrane protein OmpA-like peptidoglycan-associated protein